MAVTPPPSGETTIGDETVDAATTPTPGAAPLVPGDTLGRYVILSRVGQGGMGIVYSAYDPGLDRKVALKLLHDSDADERNASLMREAQAMAQLSHPNVATVFDVGQHEGTVYLAMEFVEGETLRRWLDAETRSVPDILSVFSAAGRGLSAAHAKGLVHRDFKPENVMLDGDGRVLVMDFGLARGGVGSGLDSTPAVAEAMSHDATLRPVLAERTLGHASGTPAYMAPEQHLGEATGRTTDVFAFCVTLWEAVYGSRPFDGPTLAMTAVNVIEGRLQSPTGGRSVPRWLRGVLVRGLERDPQQRWHEVAALLGAIERGRGRGRRVVLASVVGLGLVGVGAAWWTERSTYDQAVAACDTQADALVGQWTDARADAIAAAFVATEVPYAESAWTRARPRLERYAEQWKSLRRDRCIDDLDGAEPRSAVVRHASEVCFESGRARFVGLLESLDAPTKKTVQRAGTAASALPAVEPCLDDRALALQPPPPAADVRERAARLRERIAGARALDSVGNYEDGKTVALDVHLDAKALGWPPIIAEALDVLSDLEERLGEYEEAYAHQLEGYRIATAEGFDQLAAEAATDLVFNAGERLNRPEEGEAWAVVAQAVLERVGEMDGVRMGNVMSNLGSVRQKTGDLDGALEAQEAGVSLRRHALGEKHPATAYATANLGNVYFAKQQLDRARELHERALAIQLDILGDPHPDLAATYNNLAAIASQGDQAELALGYGKKAADIAERTLGTDHPLTAMALSNLGSTMRKLEDFDGAHETLNRSLEIRERVFGKDHPSVAYALNNIGLAYLDSGDPASAVAPLERALSVRVGAKVSGTPLAQTKWALGRAVATSDVARARTLGAEAITAFTASEDEQGAKDVQTWLDGLDGLDGAAAGDD